MMNQNSKHVENARASPIMTPNSLSSSPSFKKVYSPVNHPNVIAPPVPPPHLLKPTAASPTCVTGIPPMVESSSTLVTLPDIEMSSRVSIDESPAPASTGRWTSDEHRRFLAGLEKFGKDWAEISRLVGTRTTVQVRTHAQKYFIKRSREVEEETGVKQFDTSTAAVPHNSKRRRHSFTDSIEVNAIKGHPSWSPPTRPASLGSAVAPPPKQAFKSIPPSMVHFSPPLANEIQQSQRKFAPTVSLPTRIVANIAPRPPSIMNFQKNLNQPPHVAPGSQPAPHNAAQFSPVSQFTRPPPGNMRVLCVQHPHLMPFPKNFCPPQQKANGATAATENDIMQPLLTECWCLSCMEFEKTGVVKPCVATDNYSGTADQSVSIGGGSDVEQLEDPEELVTGDPKGTTFPETIFSSVNQNCLPGRQVTLDETSPETGNHPPYNPQEDIEDASGLRPSVANEESSFDITSNANGNFVGVVTQVGQTLSLGNTGSVELPNLKNKEKACYPLEPNATFIKSLLEDDPYSILVDGGRAGIDGDFDEVMYECFVRDVAPDLTKPPGREDCDNAFRDMDNMPSGNN